MTDERATTASDRPSPPPPPPPPIGKRPNYAARRMLVSTFVIVGVVAVGVVAWRLLGAGDEGGASGAAGSWDEILLVDRASGAIEALDGDGELAHQGDLGTRARRIESAGDRIALVGADRIVLSDGGQGDPVVVPIDLGSTVIRLPVDDRIVLAVGRDTGGNVLIVDGATGETLDVGAIAGQSDPLLFTGTIRVDADGTRFAIGDARNFQTIVVAFGADEPAYYPAQPLAVERDLVATSQVRGQRVDIGLFDAGGERIAAAPTGIPAGAVFDGDDLVVVTTDGDVLRVRDGDEAAEEVGSFTVPVGATVSAVAWSHDGERLVVAGDVFEAVLDRDGTTVFTTTFPNPVTALTPRPGWRCLPVGGDGSFHSIVSLDSGEQLADLTGLEVTDVAGDGCTVLGRRDGATEVVTADGSVTLGTVRSAQLGPDGRTVVTTSSDGTTELLRIDDDLQLGEPVVLRASTPITVDIVFLDQ